MVNIKKTLYIQISKREVIFNKGIATQNLQGIYKHLYSGNNLDLNVYKRDLDTEYKG